MFKAIEQVELCKMRLDKWEGRNDVVLLSRSWQKSGFYSKYNAATELNKFCVLQRVLPPT